MTDVRIWVEHVNNIVSRPKPRVAVRSRKKTTQEKGFYVQFYVDMVNYLFCVINVVVLWAGA